MEAAQTMQQFANLLGEFNRVCGGQHQPAPATLVHQGKDQPVTEGAGGDWDEEQRKSADRVHWLPAPAGRNQGVLAASVVDPSLFPKMGQVTATEVNSARQEERRPEAGSEQQKGTT